MVFCPICGEQAVDVFCEQHLREREPLITNVKPFTLTICSTCDRFLSSGSWEEFKRFERFIKRKVEFNSQAQIMEFHVPIPVFEGRLEEFELPIEVVGTVSSAIANYLEEYRIPIPVVKDQCDRCANAKSGYFEGILQIRNPREQVVKYIEKVIAKNESVRITQSREVKGGFDFELTNQQFLVSFVHELKKEFGGVVRKSSKLHTYDHQRSKKVYRLTCLLELPSFWIGDIIETPKRLLRVSSMGEVVKGFDLRRRKNTALACPAEQDIDILDEASTTVSRVQPQVMILDPHDYQEARLAHPAELIAGQEVSVVEDGSGKFYISTRLKQ